MSDLQLALVALGAVLVAGVAAYNFLQERRARRHAESAFRGAHPDALLEPGAQRREPVMGELPEAQREEPEIGSLAAIAPAAAERREDAPAASPSPAVLSTLVDTVALILADEPLARAQLDPLREALGAHATPVHLEGLTGEQWVPVEESPAPSWRELRAGLQLASRAGPVAEEEIAAFNETVAAFAASVGAVSQREGPAEAAERARDLDRFCADADIEVAVNVVGRAGATFGLARVRSLALENGFAETGAGTFERRGADGGPAMSLRLQDGDARRDSAYATGLTFALDVPHVADPVRTFQDMAALAEAFGRTLGGDLVDDERRPLAAGGLAAIGRSIETVARAMEAHGIPPGGALARRLFA